MDREELFPQRAGRINKKLAAQVLGEDAKTACKAEPGVLEVRRPALAGGGQTFLIKRLTFYAGRIAKLEAGGNVSWYRAESVPRVTNSTEA